MATEFENYESDEEQRQRKHQRSSASRPLDLFECCVESIESARIAVVEGGATRLEICSALSGGGITPSLGLFRTIKRMITDSNRDVFLAVLIRPRGGDFVYSDDEMRVMVEDIKVFRESGAHGIVVGALDAGGDADISMMQKFVDAAEGLEVTFHRAIDLSKDPLQVLKACCNVRGINRVLTSGGQPTAVDGISKVKEMVDYVKQSARKDDFIIAIGSGVNEKNGLDLLRGTGAHQLHGSLRTEEFSRSRFTSPIAHQMGACASSDNGSSTSGLKNMNNRQVLMITSGLKVRTLLASVGGLES